MREDGELNRGKRCAVEWVFPQIKMSCSCWDSNTRPSSLWSVAIPAVVSWLQRRAEYEETIY